MLPNFATPLYLLTASSLRSRGRYALALEPTDFKMHYMLAGSLLQQQRLEEAEAALNGCLSTGRHFSPTIHGERFAAHVHNKIGDVRHKRGRSDLAIESFQTALEAADPQTDRAEVYIAHYNLGSVQAARNHSTMELALEHFDAARQAADSDAQRATCLRESGVVLLGLRRYDDALRTLIAAAQLQPTLPRVHSNVGLAFQHLVRACRPLLPKGRPVGGRRRERGGGVGYVVGVRSVADPLNHPLHRGKPPPSLSHERKTKPRSVRPSPSIQFKPHAHGLVCLSLHAGSSITGAC